MLHRAYKPTLLQTKIKMSSSINQANPEETVWEMCERLLNLEYSVICLDEIKTAEDLDKVVCETDASVVCSMDCAAFEVKGPMTYRDLIGVFEKYLISIDGETNHVFLEKIEVQPSKEKGGRPLILMLTGS